MARVLVELDPEYVPWDVPADRPRMQRRRRRKRQRGKEGNTSVPPAVLVSVPLLLLVVACVVVAVVFGPHQTKTRASTPVPAGSPPAVASASEGEGGNLAPSDGNTEGETCDDAPGIGQLGALTLWGMADAPVYACERYVILDGSEIIATGRTAETACTTLDDVLYATRGAVVDVSDLRRFTVHCDEQTYSH